MSTKSKSKKEKTKLGKLIEKSDSENDENERELSFYMNDRVKLMKEVLKIIKPKKIKSMAPDCIKDLDIEEINSMLLEELLGISNKRLKYIFTGQNLGEDSSSTDPEDEKQPIDIISLDDVSDDDFVIEVDGDASAKKKGTKDEPKKKRIKKEKIDKTLKKKDGPLDEENLMSVLELLELQARARAIRSQLMLEASKRNTQSEENKVNEVLDDDEDDVIIEVPKNEEIVINSSDSESEQQKGKTDANPEKVEVQRKKITLIRDRTEEKNSEGETSKTSETDNVQENQSKTTEVDDNNKNTCMNDEDEIILIVDQEEMEGIIGD